MLRPKKGFENSQVSFRVGSNTFTINVKDITPELVDKMKHHTDLSYFVEEVEPILEYKSKYNAIHDKYTPEPKEYITEYNPEQHDIETVMQSLLNEEEPKKKTRKKKKP